MLSEIVSQRLVFQPRFGCGGGLILLLAAVSCIMPTAAGRDPRVRVANHNFKEILDFFLRTMYY
jgi:hypothetical protein